MTAINLNGPTQSENADRETELDLANPVGAGNVRQPLKLALEMR